MYTMSVRMLGCFNVCVNGKEIVPHLKPCTAGLLAYLAWQADKKTSRPLLCEELWHDLPAKRATRALNTTLWRLRHTLTKMGINADDLILSCKEGISLHPNTKYDSDIESLDLLVKQLASVRIADFDDDLLNSAADADSLYGGEFLPDSRYDWCIMPRESLRNRFDTLKEFAVRAYIQRGEWRHAIDQAHRLLDRDPLQEQVHQWLIICYLQIGDRLRAKSQYVQIAELLKRELGVEPLPETAALMDSMKEPAGILAASSAELPSTLQRVLHDLDTARETLFSINRQLRRPPS